MKKIMPTPGSDVELRRGDRETKRKKIREGREGNTGINKKGTVQGIITHPAHKDASGKRGMKKKLIEKHIAV